VTGNPKTTFQPFAIGPDFSPGITVNSDNIFALISFLHLQLDEDGA
jgi:hypothetical protein